MVTHDLQEAVLLSDKIAVMRAGRVLAYDKSRQLMLGHSDPYVATLMATPNRQAERVRAVLAESAAGQADE
jgi:osmoprotectant transport system ATP-binding protein